MDNYCVYKHTSPSGRIYIGISRNPERRWNNGRGYMGNIYFSRCIEKYGWENIKHEILLDGLSLQEAKIKEVEFISQYKSNIREFGYNISGGGDSLAAEESRHKMSLSRMGNKNCVGRKNSEETKKKISNSLKEYYKTHIQCFYGKHHNDATIQKLKSRIMSDITKQKMRDNHADYSGVKNPSAKSVSCYSLNGEFIKLYPYAKLAAIELHIDLSAIIKCCKGKIRTCGGFVWKYGEPGVYGWNEIV